VAVILIKQQERAFKKSIPFSILFTRTSPAIRTKNLAYIQDQLQKNNVRTFQLHLHERDDVPPVI
jgi:chromosome partitioning protein